MRITKARRNTFRGISSLVETHYFYLFEVNTQGTVFLLTDDEDTLGTHFLRPNHTNNHLHLIRKIEARIKESDSISLTTYE